MFEESPDEQLDDVVKQTWVPAVNDWVMITGLTKAQNYNNLTGKIISGPIAKEKIGSVHNEPGITEDTRYTIKLTTGKKISVKKLNLEVALDPEKAKREAKRREERRVAEKYFQVFAMAGKNLEKVIAENLQHIDENLLELIENRIDIERTDPTPEEDGVQGLQLLHKRLKRELDKIKSTPSLRLLDDCLGLFPISESNDPMRTVNQKLDKDAVQAEIKDRLKAAFFGTEEIDKALGGSGDLFALSQMLSTEAGKEMVQKMYSSQIDPEDFMDQVCRVCDVARNEQKQLEEITQKLDDELRVMRHNLSEAQLGKVRSTRRELADELSERKRVLKNVAQILEVAEDIRNEVEND